LVAQKRFVPKGRPKSTSRTVGHHRVQRTQFNRPYGTFRLYCR
jgi:hypothetical protein